MKYLISKSFDDYKNERINFVKQLVNLPFYIRINTIEGFDFYQSFPFTANPNICVILGHNFEVAKVLKNNIELIPEQNIFIISCAKNYLNDYNIPNKKIYLCEQIDDGQVLLRKGSDFGFDFNITDTEIYLAQSKEIDILKKFESCFEKVFDNIKE